MGDNVDVVWGKRKGFKRAEGSGCHVPERCNATRPHAAPLNAISSHVHTPV